MRDFICEVIGVQEAQLHLVVATCSNNHGGNRRWVVTGDDWYASRAATAYARSFAEKDTILVQVVCSTNADNATKYFGAGNVRLCLKIVFLKVDFIATGFTGRFGS